MSVHGGFCLLICNFIESNKNGGINGTGIVEKGTRNGLNFLCSSCIKVWGVISSGKLDFLAVYWCYPGMRGVLWCFWWGMAEFG